MNIQIIIKIENDKFVSLTFQFSSSLSLTLWFLCLPVPRHNEDNHNRSNDTCWNQIQFWKKFIRTSDIYKFYILAKSNIMYFYTSLIPQWVWFCGGYHSSLQVLIPPFSRWQKRHLLLLFCRPYFSKMENLMADNFWKPKSRLQKRQ